MKSFITHSLEKYLENLICNCLKRKNSLQVKIPGKDYPSEIIYDMLAFIESRFGNSGADMTLKIARQIFDLWRCNAENDSIISKIEKDHPEWIDESGNLTKYRNEIGASDNTRSSILVIVGSDCVDDKSSLAHFLDLGVSSVYKDAMHGSFADWIEKIEDETGAVSGSYTESLLKCVLNYTDLIKLDAYLCQLDYVNSYDIYSAIGRDLYKIGIPAIHGEDGKSSSHGNLKTLYDNAMTIFSGAYILDDVKVRKSKASITALKEKLAGSPANWEYIEKRLNEHPEAYSVYDDVFAYLDDCIRIIEPGCPDSVKTKLLQTDVFTLIELVFLFREKKSQKKMKAFPVYGMPLEAILSAIWNALGIVIPSKGSWGINSISITPSSFLHNWEIDGPTDIAEPDYIYKETILPLLGGLDSIIESRVFEEMKVYPQFAEAEMTSSLESFEEWKDKIHKRNVIPNFSFYINIVMANGNKMSFEYKYAYRDDSAAIYSINLIRTITELKEKESWNLVLPAIGMNKYSEMFDKPEDEVNLFFSSEISKIASITVYDLLKHSNLDTAEQDLVHDVINGFDIFCDKVLNKGLYAAVMDYSSQFCNSYSEMLDYFSTSDNPALKTIKQAIIRSFWIIDPVKDEEALYSKDFGSGIVSIIHPAMIDMFNMQINYLATSFVSTMNEVFIIDGNSGTSSNSVFIFDQLVDYASLMSPIPCMIKSDEKILDAKGSELLYMLGVPDKDSSARPSSIICQYEEDEMAETLLTKSTQQSTLIYRLLKDYYDTYMMARTSMRISVLFAEDVHAILSGILQYWEYTKKMKKDCIDTNVYDMEVTFYTLPEDERNTLKWITMFDKFLEAKKQADNDKYSGLNVTLRCQLMSSEGVVEEIKKTGLDTDIVFCYESDSVVDASVDFDTVQNSPTTDVTVKFPLVKKVLPRKLVGNGGVSGRSESLWRRSLISNRSFSIYSSYLRYLYCSLRGKPKSDSDVIIVNQIDFTEWMEIIDFCLSCSERVVAIGHNVDKGLILNAGNEKASIIGSGSGVGANADLNYVVASRMLSYDALRNRLKKKFVSEMHISNNEDIIIDNMLEASKTMADLSLIKTLSSRTLYFHDFFGYSMIRHLLKAEEGCFTDVVLAMDSYKHWFKHDDKRADLLWVRANLIQRNGKSIFNIKLYVVEAKLGMNVKDNFLAYAAEQAYSTCNYLRERFEVRERNTRYDAKFWWMQLHRIIASNSSIANDAMDPDIKAALENLADGYFNLSFDRCVIAFETTDTYGSVPTVVYKANLPDSDSLYEVVFTSQGIEKYLSHDMDCTFESLLLSLAGDVEDEVDYSLKTIKSQRTAERNAVIKELKDLKDTFDASLDNESGDIIYDYPLDDEPTEVHENSDKEKESVDEVVSVENETVSVEVPDHADEKTDEAEKGEIDMPENNEEENVEEGIEFVENPNCKLCAPTNAKILLGTDYNGEAVYWNYGNDYVSKNKHLLVLGGSGSGKSYSIQCILRELAKFHQASLIVDYTNGFTEEEIKPELKEYTRDQYYVLVEPLPVNPFLVGNIEYGGGKITQEKPFTTASRVTDIISHKFSLGDVQKADLASLIEEGILHYGNEFTMTKLVDMLEEKANEKGPAKARYTGIRARILALSKNDIFAGSPDGKNIWDDIFYDGDTSKPVTVFQFNGLPNDVTITSVDFVLADLYNYAIRKKSSQNTPHTVVLDEFQNLSMGNNSPVRKILQEGRKLGLGLILATQAIDGIKEGSSGAAVTSMFNASTVLLFHPNATEVKMFAECAYSLDSSRSKDDWKVILNKLKRGQCVVLAEDETGRIKGRLVNITPLEDR